MENEIPVKGYLNVEESTDSQVTNDSEKNVISSYTTTYIEEKLPMTGEKESSFFLLFSGIILILFLVTIKRMRTKKD